MKMIALDARKLSTANIHHVVHQIFKQTTTKIGLIIIQLFMRLNTYLGRPLWHQKPDLLLGIVGVLIETVLINLEINGRLALLEHDEDT